MPGDWEDEDESDRAKNTLLWASVQLVGSFNVDVADPEEFTRIVLGIQVLSAGVTLPSRIILKASMVKSLSILLAPVMLFAVLIGGCLAKA